MTRVSVRSICNRGKLQNLAKIYIYISVYISLILLPLKSGPKWTRLTRPRYIYLREAYLVQSENCTGMDVSHRINLQFRFGIFWGKLGMVEPILTDLSERDMVKEWDLGDFNTRIWEYFFSFDEVQRIRGRFVIFCEQLKREVVRHDRNTGFTTVPIQDILFDKMICSIVSGDFPWPVKAVAMSAFAMKIRGKCATEIIFAKL